MPKPRYNNLKLATKRVQIYGSGARRHRDALWCTTSVSSSAAAAADAETKRRRERQKAARKTRRARVHTAHLPELNHRGCFLCTRAMLLCWCRHGYFPGVGFLSCSHKKHIICDFGNESSKSSNSSIWYSKQPRAEYIVEASFCG